MDESLDDRMPDGGTTSELLELTYAQLRALAQRKLFQECPGQTLQATALVHEVYLRLSRAEKRPWDNERHFFVAAAEAMRRILIETARRKAALRRGGGFRRTEFTGNEVADTDSPDLILQVESALLEFDKVDPTKARFVRLRFYAGLSLEQAAEVSGFSLATAKRHWQYARAWLHRHILKHSDFPLLKSEPNSSAPPHERPDPIGPPAPPHEQNGIP